MSALFQSLPTTATFGPQAIRFTVYGRPRPQGSKRHVGHGIMVESSKALKPWRQDVAGSALALNAEMFGQHMPVELTADFYFAEPKKRRRAMTTRPDSDKLARAILDSLKGILLHDDAQVVDLRVRKHYGLPERCEVEVKEIR